ncbi:hypothetical protein F5Y13DRAFT_189088 [Hypoxylon sp. FL1857]|nr:hypothetical protein F5Y13DRAFT_189088 [Hypoxylon sp. FL1857]
MSRRWDIDGEEERLPHGFRRVGYDADMGYYLYRDSEGALWRGPAGSRYGELTRLSGPTQPQPAVRPTTPPPRKRPLPLTPSPDSKDEKSSKSSVIRGTIASLGVVVDLFKERKRKREEEKRRKEAERQKDIDNFLKGRRPKRPKRD